MPKEKSTAPKKGSERNHSKQKEVKIADLVLSQPHTYELMQINPEITMKALNSIEESGQFESFISLSKSLHLRPENLRSLSNVRDLNEMIKRVTNTLRIFSNNASTMGYFCEHLLRSTRKCQAFIRKALTKRRREKKFIQSKWLAVQEKAHRQLEVVVKDRVKRLKSTQSQALLEETWGVLIDCYISPIDMDAAISSYFKENSLKYLIEFRQFRKQAKVASQTSADRPSIQRRKYRESILKYPAMCEVFNLAPSVAELCVHLDHAHNMESLPMSGGFAKEVEETEPGFDEEVLTGAFGRRRKKVKPVFAPAITVLPVSYYHSLISLSPREDFQLLLALRALNNSSDQKSMNRVNGPSRQVIQRAISLKQKWNLMHGRPTAATVSDSPSNTAPKVDQFGQPKSCIDSGAVSKKPTRLQSTPELLALSADPNAKGCIERSLSRANASVSPPPFPCSSSSLLLTSRNNFSAEEKLRSSELFHELGSSRALKHRQSIKRDARSGDNALQQRGLCLSPESDNQRLTDSPPYFSIARSGTDAGNFDYGGSRGTSPSFGLDNLSRTAEDARSIRTSSTLGGRISPSFSFQPEKGGGREFSQHEINRPQRKDSSSGAVVTRLGSSVGRISPVSEGSLHRIRSAATTSPSMSSFSNPKTKQNLWKTALREHTASVQRHRCRAGSTVRLPDISAASNGSSNASENSL